MSERRRAPTRNSPILRVRKQLTHESNGMLIAIFGREQPYALKRIMLLLHPPD